MFLVKTLSEYNSFSFNPNKNHEYVFQMKNAFPEQIALTSQTE